MKNPDGASGLIELPSALHTSLAAWRDGLRDAAGNACRAIYVHGSVLTARYDAATSDINLLVVLDDFTPERLEAIAAAVAAQAKAGAKAKRPRVTPLVLTVQQIHDSSDVFPIEFLDWSRRRALLDGTDVLAGLQVEPRNLRLQCESELRSKLVGIRQAFVLRGGAPGTARDLLARAAGGSAAMFRGLLELCDVVPPDTAEELVGAVARTYGVNAEALAGPFTARRQPPQWAENAARSCLAQYVAALDALIRAVDALAVD